ncbi:MAG: hypothetical protein M1830_001078 [Pleopsidium flavum]|nr:MAG: hypothetical protein M1830_001078 [Pleopsidium flavum]
MESSYQLAGAHPKDHVFIWDKQFSVRRAQAYETEDRRVNPASNQSRIDAFLKERKPRLQPSQYSYAALRNFLRKVPHPDHAITFASDENVVPLALLDDRRDDTGGEYSSRNWDGYVRRPPEGKDIWSSLLGPKGLYDRLSKERLPLGAERRTIYITDLTPLCALAVAVTVSETHVVALRNFLQRYVSYRVYFGISTGFGFSLGFHLPYYALRRSALPAADPRSLRRTGRFMNNGKAQADFEWFHEAQISLLIVGVDEWYWTAYCCVDTYFGSEEPPTYYLEEGFDAPTGAGRHMRDPVWNPREYFLLVLSRRISQVVMEWSNVTSSLEERLGFHEESIFNERTLEGTFVDDHSFSRTKEYTWTVQILRLFHNSLVKLIESWENFEAGEIRYFDVEDNERLQTIWRKEFLASIRKDVTELRSLRRSLQQRIEMFDTMMSGVSHLTMSSEGAAQRRLIHVSL